MQQPQVLAIGLGRCRRQQFIVGPAEDSGWKQLFAVALVRECPRLAHQRPDQVPVIDSVPIASGQSRQDQHRHRAAIELERLGVQLDFTRPGKPTDNGLCESFNGRLRDECLNVNEFVSIEHARQRIEAWRVDYNEHRPHGALGHLTPSEYAKAGQKRSPEMADF